MKLTQTINGNGNLIVGGDYKKYYYTNEAIKKVWPCSSEYIHLEFEEHLKDFISKHKVTVIAGMSGMGKTEIAIAVANMLKAQFDSYFVDADKFDEYELLKKIETSIMDKPILLIIDDFHGEFKQCVTNIENVLKDGNVNGTRLVFTTQVSKYIPPEILIKLSPPTKTEAIKILFRDIDDSFKIGVPEEVVSKFMARISYMPLILKLVNKSVRYDGLNSAGFLELIQGVEVFQLEDDSTSWPVINRILNNLQKNYKKELEVIDWLDSIYLEEEILVSLMGYPKVIALKHRGIFDNVYYPNRHSYKLHDIVFHAIRNRKFDDEADIEKKFLLYFSCEKENTNFYNALFLHKNVIERICKSGFSWDLKTYLYIKVSADKELMISRINEVLGKKNINSMLDEAEENRRWAYKCFVEFRERWSRIIKERIEKENFIGETVEVYLDILAKEDVRNLRVFVQHHLGKAYMRLHRYTKSEKIFSDLVSLNQDDYEAKLQLMRCMKIRNNYSNAERFLNDILKEGYNENNAVKTSVLLAAIDELKNDRFSQLRKEYIIKKRDKFSAIIKDSFSLEFDLPFKTFVHIAKKIYYENVEWVENILKDIPIQFNEEADDSLLFDLAEFYRMRIKGARDGNVENNMIKIAEWYYKKIRKPKDYYLTQWAAFKIENRKYEDAISILSKVKKIDQFVSYRMAQAHYKLECFDLADIEIDNAINITKNIEIERGNSESNLDINNWKYLSPFYVLKGRIQNAMNRPFESYFKEALLYCNNEKYNREIQEELDVLLKGI